MTTSKPMTGEQLDELMAVAVRMQRDGEVARDFPSANFAYAVQVAVLELRGTRAVASALAAENAALKNAMAVTLEHVSIMDTGQAGVAAMIINDVLHHSETPATDSFLAEVRAQGVDAVKQRISDAISKCYQDEMVGLDAAVSIAEESAAQLRQDANTAELVAAGIITKVGE